MSDTDLPPWDASYSDPQRLRDEVRAAADAYIQALQETIPVEDIKGIYVKGSALKPWDSPIDHVPELSDIDIHVLFAHDEAVSRHTTDIKRALALGSRAERLFAQRIPEPVHTPRIQLVVANTLFGNAEFIPSPSDTIEVRYGPPYPGGEPTLEARQRVAVRQILEQRTYHTNLGEEVVDKLGKHLRAVLRSMSWRVAPSVPRVLDLVGLPFETAWSTNRTALHELLRANGEESLASEYAQFYLDSWGYFLSQDRDGEAARSAILAGAHVLARTVAIAEAFDALGHGDG